MEIRNAIAINLEGLGVELCAVAFKRDIICLSQVFSFIESCRVMKTCFAGMVMC